MTSQTPLTTQVAEKVSAGINGITGSNTSGIHTVPAIVNNKDVHFSSTFDVISPSANKVIHNSTSAAVSDALGAVDAAQSAFKSWWNTPPAQKRDIFLKAADIFASREDELAKYMVDETGAEKNWAAFNTTLSREILKDVAGRIATVSGSFPTTSEPGTSAIVMSEPYGVILGIAPAFILGVRSIVFAIACGNTAVLKAPEFSPRCYWAIGDVFRQAGLPDGVLNVIAHKPSDAAAVTKALIEDPRVKKINFTGSTLVGRIIAELAGKNLKPVLLELGGKAPAIVWKDADLKLAAQQCALGAFLHSGQICMSTERVIVHKDIAQEFELQYTADIQAHWSSQAVLINKGGVEKNHRLVKDAVSKRAKLLTGSLATEEVSTRMSPIVVGGVKPTMDLWHTESFGPTVSLIIVESEEEALRIANDTEYGLSAAVFTEDLRTGLRFAKGIESGAVHINGMTVHDETALPHGGMKSSGYGRFGAAGMEEWTRTKTVTFKN